MELKTKKLKAEIDDCKNEISEYQRKLRTIEDKHIQELNDETNKLTIFYDSIITGHKLNLENEKYVFVKLLLFIYFWNVIFSFQK